MGVLLRWKMIFFLKISDRIQIVLVSLIDKDFWQIIDVGLLCHLPLEKKRKMKYLFNNKISCKYHVLDFFNYFILSFHLYTIDREILYFLS